MKRELKADINLLALISIRKFFRNRKIIRSQVESAIVLPMYPGVKNWRKNLSILKALLYIKRSSTIICRNAFPTVLALEAKALGLVKHVVFDGRGGEWAQMKEYKVVNDPAIFEDTHYAECRAVLESDLRLAVTSSLVSYWRDTYQYNSNKHLIIPCTLNSQHQTGKSFDISREGLGFSSQDILLVYCGSVSAWQSFGLMVDFLQKQMDKNKNIKVLLLTKTTNELQGFVNKNEGRVLQKWCAEEEVSAYLEICDYGLLIRENTLTNQVASPVKFAEYLFAGLKVVVSDFMKDYADFVNLHECGLCFPAEDMHFVKSTKESRRMNRELAEHFLSKSAEPIRYNYKELLNLT